MQVNTYLADSIERTEYESQYDDCAKTLTASIPVLARILKQTVEELRDNSLADIENCIEGSPQVQLCTSDNQEENTKEKITGNNTESTIVHEGTVRYDIRFYVILPKRKVRIKIILNVELQKQYRKKYYLVTRGIFYCARMLSEQKGTEFIKDNYQDIKKVYSIWLCTDAPEKIANTISEYTMTRKEIYGDFNEEERYDLLTVVLVRISTKENGEVTNELLKMLAVLFSNTISAEIKKKKLKDEFGMKMTKTIERSIDDMCNLSQGIKQDAIRQGIQQGTLLTKIESLLEVLENMGRVPELLRKHIQKEGNLDVVKQWFSLAVRSDSLEQFMKSANL